MRDQSALDPQNAILMTRLIQAGAAKKRARRHVDDSPGPQAKWLKAAKGPGERIPVAHVVLSQFYTKLQTLRSYLLAALPSSSKHRRRKFASIGRHDGPRGGVAEGIEPLLGRFLDATLVGSADDEKSPADEQRWGQFMTFSQRNDDSRVTLSDGLAAAVFSQSEIVDFVVWLLFSGQKNTRAWPKHLLCDGFRKQLSAADADGSGRPKVQAMPGIFSVHRNEHFHALKASPWPEILTVLGKAGERVMIDLLMDHAVFIAVEAGKGNYYQLNGVPISELEPRKSTTEATDRPEPRKGMSSSEKSPSEITFVRSRMMYARAALNARGSVHPGFRHIHVLNRCPYRTENIGEKKNSQQSDSLSFAQQNENNTTKIMMYIFPRQFGLHNVFTSTVDSTRTAQKLQDYTVREEEIAHLFKRIDSDGSQPKVHIPKRLRGDCRRLVQQLQIRHGRCSYSELLKHYCPTALDSPRGQSGMAVKKAADSEVDAIAGPSTQRANDQHLSHTQSRYRAKKGQRKSLKPVPAPPQVEFSSIVDLATPASSVSQFCQAVLRAIIPGEFWGAADTLEHNRSALMKKVDHFIRMRRFESMSLHEVIQDFRTADIHWLAPPRLLDQKMSCTDARKRSEIFSEFLYYVFDSLLIPLIRSNFYVTESSVHRYRLFYFRHDVWRQIAEPAMAALKTTMFEEVRTSEALRVLESRRLGFSQLRLLPKGSGMRPIMNLRRRAVVRGNRKLLGPSINTILAPLQTVLRLEKQLNPSRLGSSMFSVGDLYGRIKAFNARIGSGERQLYFAKVDVQAAFDTIPQSAVMKVMGNVPNQSTYDIKRHVEVKPADSSTTASASTTRKLARRWHAIAKPPGEIITFLEKVETELGEQRKDTIFVDNAMVQQRGASELLMLMAMHVQQNFVKIGKKYYRQKEGIPQGSVLSSSLCNYFYADLEERHLAFLAGEDCLLLRLIDDFLLITTDRSKAVSFVNAMHVGMPEYGVTVNPGKSLVNFDVKFCGQPIARLADGRAFPYCGTRIDCRTLDISKDRDTVKDPVVSNALTVEYGRVPGRNFQRKVLNAFRIQSHVMFYDTTHNSLRTVLSNLHSAFVETATKMWAYMRCLRKGMQPDASLVIRTIQSLVDVAVVLLGSRARKARFPGYGCSVKRSQVSWLAAHAFGQVLRRKQSGYAKVIAWLDGELQRLDAARDAPSASLLRITS